MPRHSDPWAHHLYCSRYQRTRVLQKRRLNFDQRSAQGRRAASSLFSTEARIRLAERSCSVCGRHLERYCRTHAGGGASGTTYTNNKPRARQLRRPVSPSHGLRKGSTRSSCCGAVRQSLIRFALAKTAIVAVTNGFHAAAYIINKPKILPDYPIGPPSILSGRRTSSQEFKHSPNVVRHNCSKRW